MTPEERYESMCSVSGAIQMLPSDSRELLIENIREAVAEEREGESIELEAMRHIYLRVCYYIDDNSVYNYAILAHDVKKYREWKQ